MEALRSRKKARMNRAGHAEKMATARFLRAVLLGMVMGPSVCKFSPS